ncbi:hypothetical protein JOM56_014140 [Amanita muscaria]
MPLVDYDQASHMQSGKKKGDDESWRRCTVKSWKKREELEAWKHYTVKRWKKGDVQILEAFLGIQLLKYGPVHAGQPLQSGHAPYYHGRLAIQPKVSASQPRRVLAPMPRSYHNPATVRLASVDTSNHNLEQENVHENEDQNLDQQGIANPHVNAAPSNAARMTGNGGDAAVSSDDSCCDNIIDENDHARNARDPNNWAGQNPGQVIQPSRQQSSKRGTDSTEAANISRKMKKEQATERSKELQKLVADVQEYCNEKAKEIGAHTGKKPEYILKLIHSSSTFKPNLSLTCGMRLFTRKLWNLTTKLVAEEIQEKEITAEEKEVLREELKVFRALKQKGAQASNIAAAHDVEQTFTQLGQELHNLHECTGACGFTFITQRSITKNAKLTMNYSNYDMGIIQKHKVRLTGWPTDITFGTPHTLNMADEVRLLRHYLQNKTCYWERLTGEQLKAHMQECLEKKLAGSDKGKRKKPMPEKSRQGTDSSDNEGV